MIAPPPWRIELYDTLPSTQALCRERAEAGAAAYLAVMARQQTRGVGTHGRAWQSPVGNLSLSVLLRPSARRYDAPQWSLLSAVALTDTLASFLPAAHKMTVKYPNDVMLDGVKMAGILTECSSAEDGVGWVVVGFGVNLAEAPDLPERLTACLAAVIDPPTPEIFASALLQRLRDWEELRERLGFAPVRAAWLALARKPGQVLPVPRDGALETNKDIPFYETGQDAPRH